MEFILKKIKEYKRIIIFGHIRPDGDCIGSQYGLAGIIKNSFPEKEVYVTGETSDYVGFIGRPEMIDDSVFDGALGISVDVPNLDRISDQRILKCAYKIKIDHHVKTGDDFADYEYVEEEAPACADILTRFYEKFQNELKMDKKTAEALYVGILTDTGRFKFDSVKGSTFRSAALLVDNGVNLTEIDNNLSAETMNTLKLKGYCLTHFNVTENGFAYLTMPKSVMEEYGVTREEAANMVSVISTMKECPVWALFIEYTDEIRIRLRSRGPAINVFAEKWGGGGHAKASGASLGADFSRLNEFLNQIDELVKEYKASLK